MVTAPALVIHAVDALAGEPERLARAVLARLRRRADGEGLVPGARRSLLTKDRDRPDTHVQVVEFPSHEEPVANSALPETTAFAEKLPALCTSGPAFRNLDLVRVDQL
jgi:hypothetical protein